MPNPKPSDDFRNIGVLARGDLLRGITARAERDGASLAKAAAALIQEGLDAAAPASEPVLEEVGTDDLIDEIVGRLAQVDQAAAAIARADAAEIRAERAEARVAQAIAALGVQA